MRSSLARATLFAGHVWVALRLTLVSALALGAGFVGVAVAAVAFGGVTEDVTQRNGLATSDAMHLRWFVDHRPGLLVSAARVVSEIGSPPVLGLIAVAAAVALWMRGARLGLAIAPGLAFAIGAVAAEIGKSVVGRARPPVGLHLVTETNASFPSGHATDSTALFVTLALVVAVAVLRRPVLRALTVLGSVALSAAIGASRLVLGVHWPTDVLAGWALGFGVALVVAIAAWLVTRISHDTPTATSYRFGRVTRLAVARRRVTSLEAA